MTGKPGLEGVTTRRGAEGGQFPVNLTSLTLQSWEKEPEPTLPSDWEAMVGHPHSSDSQASLIPAVGPRLPGRKPWACTQKGLSVAIRGLGPRVPHSQWPGLSCVNPYFRKSSYFSLFWNGSLSTSYLFDPEPPAFHSNTSSLGFKSSQLREEQSLGEMFSFFLELFLFISCTDLMYWLTCVPHENPSIGWEN